MRFKIFQNFLKITYIYRKSLKNGSIPAHNPGGNIETLLIESNRTYIRFIDLNHAIDRVLLSSVIQHMRTLTKKTQSTVRLRSIGFTLQNSRFFSIRHDRREVLSSRAKLANLTRSLDCIIEVV